MFESALLIVLQSDNQLCSLVSKHNNQPSMFSNSAPEGVENPYIVFSISRYESGPAVDRFNIYVDCFDYSQSTKNASLASERIEAILNDKIIEHDRYGSIRLFRESGSFVPEGDPREVHYNTQFMARAGRKQRMENL